LVIGHLTFISWQFGWSATTKVTTQWRWSQYHNAVACGLSCGCTAT